VDIELPQTSAALESEDEEDIGQLLEDELEEHAAVLVNSDWLHSGGWPDEEQVSVVKVIVNDQGLVATLRVQFVELGPIRPEVQQNGAVTVIWVAFVAEQADAQPCREPGQHERLKLDEELLVGRQVLLVAGETVRVGRRVRPNRLRVPHEAGVHVFDPGLLQSLLQRRLREAGLTAPRGLTDVHQHLDPLGQ
jgi:hypothetical protein